MKTALKVLLVGMLAGISGWSQAQSYVSNHYCPAGLPLTTPDTDFSDTGSGTVLHLKTGLIWKRCGEGQTWSGSPPTCQGTLLELSWDQALDRVEQVNGGTALGGWNAGETDWRLPNVNELESIVERGCAYPAINLTQFPNTHGHLYWASSPTTGELLSAWVVGFFFGGATGLDRNRTQSNHLRLVRGGNAYTRFDSLAPRAPTLGSVTSGNKKAIVSFTPAAAGPAASTYTATCTDGSSTRKVIGTSSPITVNVLTNGVTYACSVSAANAEGSSVSSAKANVIPNPTVPGTPTLLGLIPSDTSMKVYFSPPADSGGLAITGYQASCQGSDGTHLSPVGSSSPLTITGLTKGQSYTCSVKAINSLGASASSAAMTKVARRISIVPVLGVILN